MPLPHLKTIPTIPDYVQVLRHKSRRNVDAFVQSMFKIPDLMGDQLPFTYNWTQNFVARKLREEERLEKPIRKYILKRRRVGLTSFLAARYMATAMLFDNRRIGIVAHQDDRAQEILSSYKYYYDHLPSELQFPKARDHISGLKFSSFYSSVTVGTAQNPEKIRGDGLHNVHLSETSYFHDFDWVMDEICPVVPYKPGTSIILETTGKLRGSKAHDFWVACRTGKEGYDAFFLAWLDDPTCLIQIPTAQERDRLLSEIANLEPDLAAKNEFYGLSAEQSAWAYERFVHHCRRNYVKFGTEYPYDEEEAWSITGLSYFGETNLRKLKPHNDFKCYGWKGRSYRTDFNSPMELPEIPCPKENSGEGHIKVWKAPTSNGKYVIGSDTSVGQSNSAFSAMYVIDLCTREMMAAVHGRFRFDEHAIIMGGMGKYYNNAMLAPEVNNSGLAVVGELAKFYHNLYAWRKWDSASMKTTDQYGWQTNRSTRPRMLSELLKLIEDIARNEIEDVGLFKDQALINEMRTFVENPNTGQPCAVSGSFDDRIMALAIAHIVAYQETYGTSLDAYSNYAHMSKTFDQYKPDAAQDWINTLNQENQGSAMDRINGLLSNKQNKSMILKNGFVTWEGTDAW